MIEIRNLYKRYHQSHHSKRDDDWVLKNINLTIPSGVSVGLVGGNGAGKSTLLRLIAGMDSPQKGRIERHCRVSWPIALAAGLQQSMTGRQNVKFVARMHGAEYDVDEIIRRVEDFAEIGRAFDEPIRTYSSGMRSRLNFGLSLAFEFDVYLSDEATSVGDRAFKAKATKAFKDKVNQASLIMVSHSEGILKELCEAGVYLKEGKATWYDDVKDAIAAYHADSDVSNTQQAGKTNIQGSAQEKAQGQGAGDAMASTSTNEPPPATREEARRQLRQRKAAFDGAKAAFEQAKADNLIPRERKVFGDAFRAARDRLQDAQRNLQALQPPGDD